MGVYKRKSNPQLKRALGLKKEYPHIVLNVNLINSRKFNEFYPGDKVYVRIDFYMKKAVVDGYDRKADMWIVTYESEKKGSYELKPGKDLLIYDTVIEENVKEDFPFEIGDTMLNKGGTGSGTEEI